MKTKIHTNLSKLLSIIKSFTQNNNNYLKPILNEINNQIKIAEIHKKEFEIENNHLKTQIKELNSKLNLDYKELQFKNLFIERLFLNQELDLRNKRISVLKDKIDNYVNKIFYFLKTMGILNNQKFISNYKDIKGEDKEENNEFIVNVNNFTDEKLTDEVKNIDPLIWNKFLKLKSEYKTNDHEIKGNKFYEKENFSNLNIENGRKDFNPAVDIVNKNYFNHTSDIVNKNDINPNEEDDLMIHNFRIDYPFEITIDQLDHLQEFLRKLELLKEEKEISKQKNLKKVKILCSELKIPFKKKMNLFQIEHFRTELETIKNERYALLMKMNKKICELNKMLNMNVHVSNELSLNNIQRSKSNLQLLEIEENKRIKDIFRDTYRMLEENFEIFGLRKDDFFDHEEMKIVISFSGERYFEPGKIKKEFDEEIKNEKIRFQIYDQNINDFEDDQNVQNINDFENDQNIQNNNGPENGQNVQNKNAEPDKQQISYLKKLIKKMRLKIDELLPKKEQYLSIYKLVEKRQNFVQKMIEFEQMASDPKRLFKNSVQLINEEKFRKNAIPQLLKIESKIFLEIKEYENLFGEFLIDNVPYKMVLEDEIKNRIVNKNIFIYNKDTPRKKTK
ncbi:hypothetical protein DMUE_0389 [Dictyocoela muelleri]|nr:hypothetical protein DMUE_0389 [Dictyocoela muelleri]